MQVYRAQTKLRGVQAATRLLLKAFMKDTAYLVAVDKQAAVKKYAHRWMMKVGWNFDSSMSSL